MTTPLVHPWFGSDSHADGSGPQVDWQLIHAALQETASRLSGAEQAPLTVATLLGWSAAAVRKLRPGGHHAEILQISNTAPAKVRNHPRLCYIRCQSLLRLERWDELAKELRLNSLLATMDRPMDPRLVGLSIRTGLSWILRKAADPNGLSFEKVPQNPDDFYFSGIDAATAQISGRLARQSETIDDAVMWRKKLDRFFAITGLDRTPERLFGLTLSAMITARDGKLWKSDGMARVLDLESLVLATEGKQVNDLLRQAEDLVVADVEPLRQHIAAGRNVMVLRAHSGVRLVERALCRVGVPVAAVTNGEFPKPGVRTFLAGNAASSGLVLLKLAKAVRAERHVIMLMPDGVKGTTFAQRTLFGKTLRIGIGGVKIAQIHPTALYFGYSMLIGRKFHLKLIPGALIDCDTPTDLAEAAYLDLYLTGLRHVLEGAPQDLGALGLMNCFNEEDP